IRLPLHFFMQRVKLVTGCLDSFYGPLGLRLRLAQLIRRFPFSQVSTKSLKSTASYGSSSSWRLHAPCLLPSDGLCYCLSWQVRSTESFYRLHCYPYCSRHTTRRLSEIINTLSG